MPQHQTTRVSPRALSVGCALSIFLADLILPVRVAISLAYIAVVLLAAQSSWRGSPALAALGCTGLTLLGWVCALPGSLMWMEATNRSLGLGALWIAVYLVLAVAAAVGLASCLLIPTGHQEKEPQGAHIGEVRAAESIAPVPHS